MICPDCHSDVEGKWSDEGIGSYEYWGQKCNDKNMVFVCEACGAELETENSYADHVSDMMEDSGRYREDE